MKKFRKLLSLVLAMVMVLAMAAPSWAANGTAAETTGSITITNAINRATYGIYKLFTLESYSYEGNQDEDAREGSYAYKIEKTSLWYTFVTTGDGKDYVTVNEQGYVTWKENADAAKFAEKALAYAKTDKNSDPDVYEATIEPDDTDVADGEAVEFTGLGLGYYLVDSSIGALCTLNTTNPDMTIVDKNEAPEIEKKVNNEQSNSASIGDDIPFTITITAKDGAQAYVLHDEMSEGLTLDESSFVIKLNDNIVTTTNYVSRFGDDIECDNEDCSFEIAFTQTFCDTLKDNDKITIEYKATLNANASTGKTDPETNKAILDYGDNHTVETENTETKTYTYEFDLIKVEKNNNSKILSGAQFVLYGSNNGTKNETPISLILDGGIYRPVLTGETPIVDNVITAGDVTIKGLAAGTYYLTEINAPDGYNKLDQDVTFTIVDDNLKKTEDGFGTAIKVENSTGSLLPSTGGIGTTVFYAAGIILMAGAVFFVVRRKRA